MLLQVAWKNLLYRRLTTALIVVSIAAGIALLFSIERVRSGARESFAATIAGIDLIVGARGSPINLLLYSVFHLGDAVNNLSAATWQELSQHAAVQAAIPLAMGDSWRGYRVIGTTADYFTYYRYGDQRPLVFSEGRAGKGLFDVVVGHAVAQRLKRGLGERLILAHGVSEVSFSVSHEDMPFTVVGILARTNTPTDRSLFVSLPAITALHLDAEQRHALPASAVLPFPTISALLLKLQEKFTVLALQREINTYQHEALTAIMPGVSLRQLWQTLSLAERTFLLMSFLVFGISLLGMTVALLIGLDTRRQEMAVLRSIGASPRFIFAVLMVEALLISLAGIVSGVAISYMGLYAFEPLLVTKLGLTAGLYMPAASELWFLVAIIGCALLAGCVPAWLAYRNSLADGLTVQM